MLLTWCPLGPPGELPAWEPASAGEGCTAGGQGQQLACGKRWSGHTLSLGLPPTHHDHHQRLSQVNSACLPDTCSNTYLAMEAWGCHGHWGNGEGHAPMGWQWRDQMYQQAGKGMKGARNPTVPTHQPSWRVTNAGSRLQWDPC